MNPAIRLHQAATYARYDEVVEIIKKVKVNPDLRARGECPTALYQSVLRSDDWTREKRHGKIIAFLLGGTVIEYQSRSSNFSPLLER